jgi:hypothetical protein
MKEDHFVLISAQRLRNKSCQPQKKLEGTHNVDITKVNLGNKVQKEGVFFYLH